MHHMRGGSAPVLGGPAVQSASLVVARNVKKSFRHMGRTLEVLRGIDLDIGDGEMVGIVGPSGAGKSTLLHCIGTLDIPTTGSIRLAGEEVTALPPSRLAELRNRTIGFVFQFHHLLPEFNALENVLMPGLVQGRPRREIETRARALLEEVGLKERTLHRPGELSGGEQQRVALARALMLEPRLLLADEPTGNLDSSTSAQIHDLFFAINAQRGTTIVVVTHNQALAASMQRVVTLRDGHVEKDERLASGPRQPAEPVTSAQ
jgi:lipoprotein-releasing system ATP-binding protein